ncbi:unnamed protein product [Fusarium graminearum]|uniref:Chromosome 3, complete genome n=1 Tax=Gibberella zeae (strain ATCC MYA-4620 / CBS 123657 / FGSC 9075 / NRRL 31084 / PH-1) TaxID=229533 RepID=I1RPR0_GIBZE|nr:hypothetical protein FGSG_06038 [Fusarium graminearum PH-1]ESU12080.1 hypothetical protein FGSG_06038 [Fusarium graminearum PH-1]CEF88580.1 unnamed protein product [Fusarium graminearum]CZS84769.1 unnamed protein product [Fusarium graminearum]|eukprot:XP_011324656.1 hypothetical protein FGSG_06038 [Fusarium graminearum PH-1]
MQIPWGLGDAQQCKDMTWYLDQVIHSASNALAGECRQASMGLAKAKLFSSSTVKQTRLCLELIIRAEPWAESHRQSPLFILLKERPPLAYLFRVFVASMERTHHPWACISTVFDLLFACPRLETRITLIIPPMLEALQIHPQHKNTWLCSKLSTLGTLSRRPISHLAVMSKNADCGDDGDDYNSSCCIGCCRAGDFGTHDGCGPCYCRRSFKQDHDRTIYTGWSLGQYYPGEKGHGGPSPITGEDKPMSFENRLGGMKQASEQQAQKSGENKEVIKNETDKSIKTSKTSPKKINK